MKGLLRWLQGLRCTPHLQEEEAKKIDELNSYYLPIIDGFRTALFSAVVKKVSPGAFITDDSFKLLKSENVTEVPWLFEATTEERALNHGQEHGMPPQIGFGISEPIGTEDCLYLNIYVPEDKLNDKSNLDVILHIHGGAFMIGDPNFAGPGYLMDRNIVYLTINYRLSTLGFLSTEDDVVSGNMGSLGSKVIESFGGNPNSVTIAGLSAGAACVHLHYFSLLSRGLFHRGISKGGTALAPWAIHKAPLKEAKRLAASLNCDDSSTRELIKCLKEKPARQIIQNSHFSPVIDGFPIAPFSPVVEKESASAFLIDDPYKLLKSGNVTDVPWLSGATTEEGILILQYFKFQYNDLNEDWDIVLPDVLNYKDTVVESNKVDVAHKIKTFYLNDNKVTEDNIQSAIKLFGGRYFHLDLERPARLQSNAVKSPVYSYIYGYRQDMNFEELFGIPKDYGVGHGRDAYLLYIVKFLGITFAKDKLSMYDETVKEFFLDIVTYIVTFARDGKPISNGITWEPVVNPEDKLDNKSNLDVIVHIHGGAFMMRSASMVVPEHLIDRNVIFLSINYRLSALRFLSTEDDVVSENMRLKDQVIALRYIVTSFAKEGKPVSDGIKWEPVVNSGNLRYLLIHNDEIKMTLKNELAPAEFWQSLPLREYENITPSPSLGEDGPLIETTLGKIRGYYLQSYGGRKFAAFEGIPYAKPPIDDLRFEKPVEIEPWTGVLNATVSHTCIQVFWITPEPAGSEDCLYLNVYVPQDKLDDKSNLDVIVHIHGGAFKMGSASMAGSEYFMDRNVVYVSMNYRLSALGFLSTEDDVVSGNMGLKDQVMALRWVQKHIKHFGGNPDSVTIIGASSGSACAHLHYFSPLSRGLFHRGISQGGTALVPWAIHKAPLKEARRLGASVGCDNSSTRELVKCLKQKPVTQIIQNSYFSPTIAGFPLAPFAPVIEKESPDAFITDDPYILLKSGNIADIPWLSGGTTEEGVMILQLLQFQYNDLNERWDTVLPDVLNYENIIAETDKIDVAHKIRKFYLSDNKVTEDNIQSAIKLFGDRYFNLALEKSIRLQAIAVKSPVYAYIYGYQQDAHLEQLPKQYGVGHGGDIYFLYVMKFLGTTFAKDKLSKSDEKMKEFLLDIVTSFAKDGKPISNGITWEPVLSSDELHYLSIHNDEIKMTSKNELAFAEFWQSLPLREYENNIVTPPSLGEDGPLVETTLGKVRGYYLHSYGGRKFAAFEGIPYAKPPIGDLRFEEPVEIEPWTGVWYATTPQTCPQIGWLALEPVGSEDCLYLNVFVPQDKLDDKSNLDVIVHIHGGAFMIGAASMAGPEYLMDRNVVYVSMNYRLSALGFLSTDDDVVSGNMGLKDQVMALRWVQKHIKHFGGNPNSVTIIGASSGAASVHFHYFSPLSRGLFHRGISQGGTALAPWALHKAPLKEARRLGASVDCDKSSTEELIKCLKQKPAIQIIQNSYYSPNIARFPLAPFARC
ncbi:hypothetical protein ILUMI_01983 [Ignelater luminosus]|uniref:Carboxylesterase type B domain-containing protein n=1 Tax=Ignelater luminosus TaxID=2038154 RepID=A0A8K0DJ06_IGNLU|nr:hypothetical protein ILUMI_01983 [Ignelater luminosus]